MFLFWYLHFIYMILLMVWLDRYTYVACGITEASHGIWQHSTYWMLTSLHIWCYLCLYYLLIFIFWSSHLPFEFTYNMSPLLCFIAFIISTIGNYILKNPVYMQRSCIYGWRIHINTSQWKLMETGNLWNLQKNNWCRKCYEWKITNFKYKRSSLQHMAGNPTSIN